MATELQKLARQQNWLLFRLGGLTASTKVLASDLQVVTDTGAKRAIVQELGAIHSKLLRMEDNLKAVQLRDRQVLRTKLEADEHNWLEGDPEGTRYDSCICKAQLEILHL